MKSISRNIIIFILAFIGVAFIIIINGSYAYFSRDIQGSESSSSIQAGGGHMIINYNDGSPDIIVDNIKPRDEEWIVKNFTVSADNTTNLSISYKLSLIIDSIELVNPITYSLEGINVNNNGSLVPNKNDVTVTLGENVIGVGSFNNSINDVHSYTLKMFFKDNGLDQNIDQGKMFTAHVVISEE